MATTAFKQPSATPSAGLGAKTVSTKSALPNGSSYGGVSNAQLKQMGRTRAKYAANGKKV